MNLRWTDAGRAALADAANVGTAALRLTHFALGDAHGPGGEADDGRTALRSERHRAATAGTPATDGRIALRADFAPDASYGITEAGVFGRAGDPAGPLELYLYWSDGGTLAGQAADGTALAIGAVVEFQAAAADVAVTVGGNIEFGQPPDEASQSEYGLTRYATTAETDSNSATRSVTPKGLRAKLGALLARMIGAPATQDAVYQFRGAADGTLVVEERTQDAATSVALMVNSAAIVTLQNNTMAATTTRRGIVELATQAEIEAGAGGARAVPPDGLQAALPKVVAGLKDSAPAAGEKLILEGVAGGGVKVVPSPFELYRQTAEQSIAEGSFVNLGGVTQIPVTAGQQLMVVRLQIFRQDTNLRLDLRLGATRLSAFSTDFLGSWRTLSYVGFADFAAGQLSIRALCSVADCPPDERLGVRDVIVAVYRV